MGLHDLRHEVNTISESSRRKAERRSTKQNLHLNTRLKHLI